MRIEVEGEHLRAVARGHFSEMSVIAADIQHAPGTALLEHALDEAFLSGELLRRVGAIIGVPRPGRAACGRARGERRELALKNLSVNSIIPFRAACDAAREGSDGDKEAGKEAGGLMGGNR